MASGPVIKELRVSEIRLDGGTQSREQIDEQTVSDYAEVYQQQGDVLPPVRVFWDGSDHWLSRGFHRLLAEIRVGFVKYSCEVFSGTLRDAILDSVGDNATHGLRRNNADKRRAIKMLLTDEEWREKSDRWIADRCVVHHTTVSALRHELNGHPKKKAEPQQPAKAEQPKAKDKAKPGKSKPRKPAEPAEEVQEIDVDAVVYDELGAEVPAGLREAFTRIQRLADLEQDIARIRRAIETEGEGPAGAWLPVTRIITDLNNARNAIRYARPYCLCPECAGSGCQSCKRSGYWTKEAYKQSGGGKVDAEVA